MCQTHHASDITAFAYIDHSLLLERITDETLEVYGGTSHRADTVGTRRANDESVHVSLLLRFQ